MSNEAYYAELRSVLRAALCLSDFPSATVERHNKPCIETEQPGSRLLLPPRRVVKGSQADAAEEEHALVEQSINSTRVSFRFRAADEQEQYLICTILRFLVHRADQLDVVRRVPLPGYDLSFLVTNQHLLRYHREALIDFMLHFVQQLHAEVSAMKLSLRSRARAVAAGYWQHLERRQAATCAGMG